MKILFVTIAWPEKGDSNLYTDLMDEFILNGHDVFVVCADEKTSKSHQSTENNINVLRVGTSRVRKVNKIKKAIALFSMGSKLEKALLNTWPEKSFDLIISHSPPVTLSGLFRSLKKRYNARLYYLLKDIWPQGPADLGLISDRGPVFRYFRMQEKRMYRTADFIGCMSEMNVEYILRKDQFLDAEKVEVCPNSIKPRSLQLENSRAETRKKFNIPEGHTVFLFSGNIGKAHGLEFYIEAIESVKDIERAYFLIGGSGQYFNYVVKEIKRRGLQNIGYYKRLPAGEFDQLLLACDVGVVLLNSKYTVPQFPSRLLAYLEARLPVFCSVNEATDIGTIVESSGCGITTLHGDLKAFRRAVDFFSKPKNRQAVESMRVNSETLLSTRYTTTHSYEIIMNRLN